MNAAMNDNEVVRQQGCRKPPQHGRRKNCSIMLSSMISVALRHKSAMRMPCGILQGRRFKFSRMPQIVLEDDNSFKWARMPQVVLQDDNSSRQRCRK
jgi:hypothetical protein